MGVTSGKQRRPRFHGACIYYIYITYSCTCIVFHPRDWCDGLKLRFRPNVLRLYVPANRRQKDVHEQEATEWADLEKSGAVIAAPEASDSDFAVCVRRSLKTTTQEQSKFEWAVMNRAFPHVANFLHDPLEDQW